MTKLNLQAKKTRIIIVIITVLVLLALAIGIYIDRNPKPEDVLRKYLKDTAQSSQYSGTENYSGTGSELKLKGTINLTNKKLIAFADGTCESKADTGKITINSSIQIENSSTFLRINNASGSIDAGEGQKINLKTLYSKIKGRWYKLDDEDKAIKMQLDSGVIVSSTGIMAPAYDTERIVNTLINDRVIQIESSSKENGNYLISVKVTRSTLEGAIKKLFPNLSNVDLILDGIFDDQQDDRSTITLSKNGKFLGERKDTTNECVKLIKEFTGSDPTDLSKRISGNSTQKKIDAIKPIRGAKPFSQFSKDFVY